MIWTDHKTIFHHIYHRRILERVFHIVRKTPLVKTFTRPHTHTHTHTHTRIHTHTHTHTHTRGRLYRTDFTRVLPIFRAKYSGDISRDICNLLQCFEIVYVNLCMNIVLVY
jgi:hypothetical protein